MARKIKEKKEMRAFSKFAPPTIMNFSLTKYNKNYFRHYRRPLEQKRHYFPSE